MARWVAALVGGTLGGSALSITLGHVAAAAGFSELGALVWMVVTGGLEGLLIGAAQRWAFPRLGSARWVAATGLGFALGWLVGVMPSVLQLEPVVPTAVERVWMSGAFGAVLGLGVSMVQWYLCRSSCPRLGGWAAAHAAGWAAALVIGTVAQSIVPDGALTVRGLLAQLAGAAAGGFVVAQATYPSVASFVSSR